MHRHSADVRRVPRDLGWPFDSTEATEQGDRMTEVMDPMDADRALKARHRAMWALGDYDAVATQVIPALGPVLVDGIGIKPGDRVLDVAAGSGNASLPAARAGAKVVASDLTPELLERGRHHAASEGLDIDWHEGDAESLPYEDESFDATISLVGVMFAPHHQASADELTRVTRPGGRIGLISWTPEGFIGQMFATMKPYAPPPPAGAQPPPLWGREDHVRGLLGDRVTDVQATVQNLTVDAFSGPEEFLGYFKRNYGPTIAVYKSLADQPERVAALDQELTDLAARFGFAKGARAMDWEYLHFTATRA
jgi:2-polyprenyl-3-methyl-5-hydroxy-6-metoxy-1,4-benzoquinol methylase